MEGADKRPEELINSYAKARVGVQKIGNAIGSFALLWSTVVLLGGFVSILTIKDFWFLSMMSLLMASKSLQAWGNNGISMAERDILRLTKGQDQLVADDRLTQRTRIFIVFIAVAMKIILVFSIWAILSVSAYVVLVLSVVRLIQRDYGDAGGDAANKAKMTAALIIFYVLVIFQSLSSGYYVFLSTQEPWFLVSKQFGFGVWGPKFFWRYRTKTMDKCYNDGVLPNNWNLITFSVGLLESATSRKDRLWGARVLDTFIGQGIPIRRELLTSTQAIQNLIDMIIGPTRTYDPEIRERAARILADLASELRTAEFPDVLRCICCLLESCKQYGDPEVARPSENSEETLDTKFHEVEILHHSHHQEDAHLSLGITEQTDDKQVASDTVTKRRSWKQTMQRFSMTGNAKERRDWDRYFGNKYHYSYASKGTKELIFQGLVILERLIQDEYNYAEIIQDQKLVSKIILPLSYHDFLSKEWDHTWVEILGRSRTVMSRLISAAAGPTDNTIRLRRDMSCNVVAIRNLIRILEADSEGAREVQEPAIEILTELAFDDSFRKLAFDESTSMTEIFVKTLRRIFHEDRDSDAIVANQDEEKDKRTRRKAGEALARLLRIPNASTFTTNINIVHLLPKQDMINLLTRAVNQILSSKPKKAMRAGTRQFSAQENEEQSEDRKMLVAMLSLTVAISNKNVISGDDFTRAIPDDDAAFVKKLKEIVERNMDTTTDGWRIQKLICQVVIATVQLKPSCIKELNGHNFEQVLSKALETMLDVDNGMLFAGNDREVPARSLTSLVKEAHELLAQEHGDIISTR